MHSLLLASVCLAGVCGGCKSKGPPKDHLTEIDREPIHRACPEVAPAVAEVLKREAAKEAAESPDAFVSADGQQVETPWTEKSKERGYRWLATLAPADSRNCTVRIVKESKRGSPPSSYRYPRQAMLELAVLERLEPERARRIVEEVRRHPGRL